MHQIDAVSKFKAQTKYDVKDNKFGGSDNSACNCGIESDDDRDAHCVYSWQMEVENV